MKKLILILTLIFALTLCFVACDELGDNSDDGQSQNVLSNGTPETEEPMNESDNTYTVEDVSLTVLSEEEKNEKLLSKLIKYLKDLHVNYDMIESPFCSKMGNIKSGAYAYQVAFDSENYYYICGYYNSTHEFEDYESVYKCCVDKYNWVKFESPEEISEYYNGEKLIVAFQINKARFVKNIFSDSVDVPQIEHFQIYDAVFENGLNIKDSICFDEMFIYLTHSKDSVEFHSVSSVEHRWITIYCVDINGESYIAIPLCRETSIGSGYSWDLEWEFGEYYNALTEILIKDRYSEKDKNDTVYYYGLLDFDEFGRVIFSKVEL